MTFLNIEEWFTGAFGDMEFYVSDHCIIQYDLLKKTFSTIEMGTGTVQYDRIETHSDSVLVDGKTLILEDSYQPKTFYEDYTYDGEGIYTAIVSKNKNWIGCMVLYYWGTQDGHYNNSGLSSGIWNATNGSKLLRDGYLFPSQIDPAFLEIVFSFNDQFFYSRIVAAVNDTGNPFDTYLTPLLSLVNIAKQKRWDAEYDVDFSSNGHYLVTFAKNFPSLIDIEKNEIIIQYKIPARMFAICMSQNMQYVYIACNDNKNGSF